MPDSFINELARAQWRLCWVSLASFLALFLGALFLPVTKLTSLALFVLIALWELSSVYRLTGVLRLSQAQQVLYLTIFSFPLLPFAGLVIRAREGADTESVFFSLLPLLMCALVISGLISAAVLVRLNLAAIRKLDEMGLRVSFLGTTLARRL